MTPFEKSIAADKDWKVRFDAQVDAFMKGLTYGLLRVSERKHAVIRLSGIGSNDNGTWMSADFKFVEGFERVSYSAAREKLKELTLKESKHDPDT